MKERELERTLKKFKRVKAPSELDERLAPYLEKKRRTRWRVPVYATSLMLLLAIVYAIFIPQKRKSSIFYQPLYAAYTVPGYFDLSVPVDENVSVKVLLDSEIMLDSTFTSSDTLSMEITLSPGLHYIIVETYDSYGDLQDMKTIDLYSL